VVRPRAGAGLAAARGGRAGHRRRLAARATSTRERADRDRLVGPDGWSYAKVDPARFAVDGPEVFEWARRKVGEGSRAGPREVWVYLVAGEWGRDQPVLIYDRAASTATVELYRERRR
jgi:hypothetical protein